MRLAIYYPWLYLTSGAERTILEIARRSRHQVRIFTSRFEPEATFPELSRMDVTVLGEVPVQRNPRAVANAALQILSQPLDLSQSDALLVVCEGLGDLVALRAGHTPTYNLCLTPLRIAFDPVYRARYLETRGPLHRLLIGAGSAGYRLLDRFAWRRYRRVFAISNEIRGRILAGKLAPPERISVLHPGIELSDFHPSPARERTFFVPGRIMWTKNLELAIHAFRIFRASAPEPETWRLRIAGIVDRKSESYLERLRQLAGDDPAIEFVVHPSDAEMRAHYESCFATLFTAFNEDWGLVVIEAMASGKPVVAVDRGGPREILRHRHDGLLAAAEPERFSAAMLELARDPEFYARIAGAAVDSSHRFGWDSFVNALDTAIESDVRAEQTRPTSTSIPALEGAAS